LGRSLDKARLFWPLPRTSEPRTTSVVNLKSELWEDGQDKWALSYLILQDNFLDNSEIFD
jgi:hypothetical protein